MNQRLTIDLEDLVEDLQDDIETIDEELQQIEAEAEQLGDGVDDEADLLAARQTYAQLEQEYDDLADAKAELEDDLETVEAKIRQEWGGSEFEARKLMWGHHNQVDDMVRAKTIDDNQDDTRAKIGAYKSAFVTTALVSAPPSSPEKASAYPKVIGEYLYDRINAWNRRGDTGLPNSLRDQVEPPDSTQN